IQVVERLAAVLADTPKEHRQPECLGTTPAITCRHSIAGASTFDCRAISTVCCQTLASISIPSTEERRRACMLRSPGMRIAETPGALRLPLSSAIYERTRWR